MAEWEPWLGPYARGYVTRARPLWETRVVPAIVLGRRPLRPRTVLHCGGPPGRAPVCSRVSSDQRSMKVAHPSICARLQIAVSLGPPEGATTRYCGVECWLPTL